jgi:hypothetical protein
MAQFSSDQAAAVAAIQQVINDWGHELDHGGGRTLAEADVLAPDCRYLIGGEWRESADAVARYYRERWDRLEATGGAPVIRMVFSNFRTRFVSEDRAEVTLMLQSFAGVGEPPFIGHCDASALADVEIECRRDVGSHWRISRYEGRHIFERDQVPSKGR